MDVNLFGIGHLACSSKEEPTIYSKELTIEREVYYQIQLSVSQNIFCKFLDCLRSSPG